MSTMTLVTVTLTNVSAPSGWSSTASTQSGQQFTDTLDDISDAGQDQSDIQNGSQFPGDSAPRSSLPAQQPAYPNQAASRTSGDASMRANSTVTKGGNSAIKKENDTASSIDHPHAAKQTSTSQDTTGSTFSSVDSDSLPALTGNASGSPSTPDIVAGPVGDPSLDAAVTASMEGMLAPSTSGSNAGQADPGNPSTLTSSVSKVELEGRPSVSEELSMLGLTGVPRSARSQNAWTSSPAGSAANMQTDAIRTGESLTALSGSEDASAGLQGGTTISALPSSRLHPARRPSDGTQANGDNFVDMSAATPLGPAAQLTARHATLPNASNAFARGLPATIEQTDSPPTDASEGVTQTSSPILNGANAPIVTDVAQAAEQAHASSGTVVPPTHQIASAAVTVINSGNDSSQITLHLQPIELGAVQIRVERTAPGLTHIEITAAKPETLAALQSSEDQLHQSLDLAGVPTAGRLVTFHLPEQSSVPNPSATALSMGGPETGMANPQSDGGSRGGYPGQPRQQHANNGPDQVETGMTVSINAAQSYRIGLNITA